MAEADGITVRAIPGTRAVILGMDAVTDRARENLLGFGIGKRRPDGGIDPFRGFKFFAETVPDPQPGERRSTFEHPIQDFQWGDYAVPPASDVTYVVRAIYGDPGALEPGPEIEVKTHTGNDTGSRHEVHFNRGAIPSQAFADRFGNVGPTEDEVNDPRNEKVEWLSRGLLEAMLGFIAEARRPSHELRVAAYEFVYRPVLDALAAAAGRGATVRICFDAGDRRRDGSIMPSHTSAANLAEIARAGLDTAPTVSLHPRTRYVAIPHNKFMVLRENGRPVAVWTGSTNFTPSGFLGQSNVAHLIRDPELGTHYDALTRNGSLMRTS
jgi:PLD-like domain